MGSACGSTFLNRIFRKFLEGHLGELEGFEDDTLEDALTEFETIMKRRFTGTEESVVVRVPGVVDSLVKGVRRQKLTIQGSVLKNLFRPVMTAITTLIKAQLQQSKKARAVILVGGFGQSAYLRTCIQQVIDESVEIMQPAYGWTAVVRGALLKSLHNTSPDLSRVDIASRQARRAYGIINGIKWRLPKHAGCPKYWDSYDGFHRVDEMYWFVSKGDKLDQRKPLTAKFYRSEEFNFGPLDTTSIESYGFEPLQNEPAPTYPNSSVNILLELTADLSSITAEIPISVGEDGKRYYRLDFDIKVAFFSAHIEFSFWYRGKEYGKVNAQWQ